MTKLTGITPTPAQLALAYKESFAEVIKVAGGKDGRISKASARKLLQRTDAGQLVADNVLNFLEATGQKTVSSAKFTEVVSEYVQRHAERAAGPNQRLSLVEIRNMPQDIQADALHLRGKDELSPVRPTIRFDENGVYEKIDSWRPTASIRQGTITLENNDVKVSGLNDVGEYQPLAEEVLIGLWDNVFVYRFDENPLVAIGPRGTGELRFGEVSDEATGKAGVMVHWKDLDDNSFAWFFERKDDGSFNELHEVYLN